MKRLLLLLLLLLLAVPAFAHREDYIGETLVFLTLERHSLEPEAFADFAHGQRVYNAALEYGITEHSMVDARVSWDRGGELDAARVEGRHRFGDEGDWPVDVAVSLEGNFETEEGKREYGVEPRLILSKDIKQLNFTVNVSEELRRHDNALRFASGVRYDATQLVRVGSELQYDWRTRDGNVIPQLWLAFPHEVTFKAGYGAAFHGARHFVRAAVELEF